MRTLQALLVIHLMELTIASTRQKRVVGGYKCNVEQYPYMVSLRATLGMFPFCGGTLITERWVLSSVQCKTGTPYHTTVVAGLSGVERDLYGVTAISQIDRYVLAPDFDPATLQNDLMMLHTIRPLRFTETIQPVKLPTHAPPDFDFPTACPRVTVIGYGGTYRQPPPDLDLPPEKEEPPPNDHLRCAILRSYSDDVCAQLYPFLDFDYAVCTESTNRTDICTGDAGGPLMCEGVQHGVVSQGSGCANDGRASVYTDLVPFAAFVNSTSMSRGGGNFAGGVLFVVVVASNEGLF